MLPLHGGINFLMILQDHVTFLEQYIGIFCIDDYSLIFFFTCKLYIIHNCSVCCIYSMYVLYMVFVFMCFVLEFSLCVYICMCVVCTC